MIKNLLIPNLKKTKSYAFTLLLPLTAAALAFLPACDTIRGVRTSPPLVVVDDNGGVTVTNTSERIANHLYDVVLQQQKDKLVTARNRLIDRISEVERAIAAVDAGHAANEAKVAADANALSKVFDLATNVASVSGVGDPVVGGAIALLGGLFGVGAHVDRRRARKASSSTPEPIPVKKTSL